MSLPHPAIRAVTGFRFLIGEDDDVCFWLSLTSARKSGLVNQIPTAPSVEVPLGRQWNYRLRRRASWAALSTQEANGQVVI